MKLFKKSFRNEMSTYKLETKYVTMSKSTLALAPNHYLTFWVTYVISMFHDNAMYLLKGCLVINIFYPLHQNLLFDILNEASRIFI